MYPVGIRPDTGYAMPDILYLTEPDIRPDIGLGLLRACAVEADNSLCMRKDPDPEHWTAETQLFVKQKVQLSVQ